MGQLAYALKARGIKAGDRVLVCGPNVPFVADALQAVASIQAIVVPINSAFRSSELEFQLTLSPPPAARLTENEVAYLLDNSGASLVLVDTEFVNLVASAKVPVVSCDDSGLASDPYEQFLLEGAEFDRRHGDLGWGGLEFQADEHATFAISDRKSVV